MDNNQASSTESSLQNAMTWDLAQWTQECALLTPAQLSNLVPYARPEIDNQHWKEKLQQLYTHLPNVPVESFGKMLTTTQFQEIIRFAAAHQKDGSNQKKLSSLFVGISPAVFRDLLSHASQEELLFFRTEAVTEPIQHQLSLITNEISQRFNEFCNQIVSKENEVQAIDLQRINSKEITNQYQSFENLLKEGKNILNLASRGLTIAWNANRSDLIQELGRIKELCQKCLNDSVGKIATKDHPSTGLYQILDKKVDLLFSDQDSKGNLTLMKDSTPALEALVKFAVWYVQDYSEVGLLPKTQLSSPSGKDSEEDLNNREQLFITAEENLGKMGLKTLSDLKNARIFSKRALKEYISAFQNSPLNP